MSILLVDADSKNGFPNLALMKLSAYYKQQGHDIDLIKGIPETAPLKRYDKVFISCVFFQNREKVLDYASQFDDVVIGGSGFDYGIRLDDDIEHIMPDYSLYDVDFSMGFTSRGCIRNCGFCIVPQKEGMIRDNAPITEFLHPDHKKVILLDNNFQASPEWHENISFIQEHDLKVNFNQGIDCRIVTEEFAHALANTKFYDWHFKTRGLYMAFDSMTHEKPLKRALQLFEEAGIPRKRFLIYILAGYDTTHEEDLYRIDQTIDFGAIPYIMPYNQSKDPFVRHLARYVNRKYYEFVKRNEYNGGVLCEPNTYS